MRCRYSGDSRRLHACTHATHAAHATCKPVLPALAYAMQVSDEEGMALPNDSQIEFTLKLFDLNQDGQLTTNEMLTSLALDAVVSTILSRRGGKGSVVFGPSSSASSGQTSKAGRH